MTHTSSTLPNWFSSDICMLANILALEVSWIEEHILSLQWMCVKHWHTGTSRCLLGRRCGELWAPKTGIFASLWLTMESSGAETLNSVPQWTISQMSVKYLSLSFDCCLYVAHVFLVSSQTQQKYRGFFGHRSCLYQEDAKLQLSLRDAQKPTGEEYIYIHLDIHNIISNIYRMCLEDFCSFFTDFDVCCLCPSFLDGEEPCKWSTSMFEGRWVADVTAGGCMNYKGIATTYGPQI